MMKSEFENLTNVKVTDAEYAGIEKQYLDMDEKITKQIFCKMWLSDKLYMDKHSGFGLPALLNARQKTIYDLLQELEEVRASEMKYVREYNDAMTARSIYRDAYLNLCQAINDERKNLDSDIESKLESLREGQSR